MCGIVGLFLKDKSMEPQLGALLSEMLVSLTDRGPDSAGIAIYGAGDGKHSKITIQSAAPERDFAGLDKELGKKIGAEVTLLAKSTHAVDRGALGEARRSPRGDPGAAPGRAHHGRRRRHRDLQGSRPARRTWSSVSRSPR